MAKGCGGVHLDACLDPAREVAGHGLPDALDVYAQRLLQDVLIVAEQKRDLLPQHGGDEGAAHARCDTVADGLQEHEVEGDGGGGDGVEDA